MEECEELEEASQLFSDVLGTLDTHAPMIDFMQLMNDEGITNV